MGQITKTESPAWLLFMDGRIAVFEKMLKTEGYDTSTIPHGDSIVDSKDSMETAGEAAAGRQTRKSLYLQELRE